MNRRALLAAGWVALLLGCASAPPPEAAPPRVASATAPVAAPSRPSISDLRFQLLDADGERRAPPLAAPKDRPLRVEARRTDGRLRWWLALERVDALEGDGQGTLWLIGTRPGHDGNELFRIESTGKGQSQPLPRGRWRLGGPIALDGTMVVAETSEGEVWIQRTARDRVASLRLRPTHDRPLWVTARGLLLLAGEDGGLRALGPDGATLWNGSVLAPPGDVSRQRSARPRVTLLPSGAVWLIAPDRRLVGHDPEGQRHFVLGTRDPVERLWPLENGDVLAATRACELWRLDDDGGVAWKTRVAPADGGPCTWEDSFFAEGERGELAVRVVLSGQSDRVRRLGRNGEPRWDAASPSGSWLTRLAVTPSGDVTVRDDVTSWLLAQGTAATVPPGAPAPRSARFVRVLAEAIDSGLALGSDHALAQSGERIWEWRGGEWRGGARLTRRLAPHTTEGLRLTGFAPDRLARGPGGEVWLCGLRHTTGGVPAPDLLTALRRRGDAWEEDAALRAAFAPHVFEDLSSETGPHLRVASSATASLACSAQHCRLPSGVELPLGEATVSAVGLVAGEPWVLTSEALARLEGTALVARGEPVTLSSTVALFGTRETDVWAVGAQIAHRVDGEPWKVAASPVGSPTAIWGPAPDDVWLTGSLGIAHFDGRSWERVVGLHGDARGVFGVDGHVWFAMGDGLWELERWTNLPLARPPAPPPIASAAEPPRLEPHRCAADAFEVRAVTFPVTGDRPLLQATEVAVAPDGTTWFLDADRVVEVRDGVGTALRHPVARTGHARLAPVGPGRGWLLGELGVLRIEGARATLAPVRLPELEAIDAGDDDHLWAVSATDDDALPHALTLADDDGDYAPEVPAAAYAAVAASGASEAFLVGGLDVSRNASQPWPAGEGLLVHRSANGVAWHRVPAAPLLAVAAAGPGEAWAVGAAGAVVHLRAGAVTTRRLSSAVWLRDVASGAGGELWIVGDDGTLLHGDGTVFTAATRLPLPPRPALVSVAPRGRGRAWVVGPDGILDVTARAPCP